MKPAKIDFARFENAVRRGLGREPDVREAELAWALAQSAVQGDRRNAVAFALAVHGGASITFDSDGEPLVHVRADQLEQLVAELALLAARRYMN